MIPLALVGFVTLLAQQGANPSGDDIWRLGGFVVAMVLGASAVYRWGVVPERARAEKAETRADAADERTREAYKVTIPAVDASNQLADRVLAVLPGVEALITQKRPRS